MSCARLVIGGAASGVGKTTFTSALARALRERGLRVQTFKCGPDYLDPTYHTLASGRPCHNLDPWMMGEAAVRATFALATSDADIALIEGVMGLFDGRDPESDESSTAHVAKLLDAPVLLVADASGMARSFAALVHGYASFDPALKLVAALANRVGSAGHAALLARALPKTMALFWLEQDDTLGFAERELGLVRATETTDARLAGWARKLEATLDLDALVGLARATDVAAVSTAPGMPASAAKRCRIAIARDDAFHFYYPYNLHLLEAAGAELVAFSPLAGDVPAHVHGVIIGGGYPELYADRLGPTSRTGSWLRGEAARGIPIYAECGGLMWLTRALTDASGARHPMLGLLDAEVVVHAKRQALGYTALTTTRDTFFGASGQTLYGHEFRYSELLPGEALATGYTLAPQYGRPARAEGYGGTQNLLASYVHLHWGRTPEAAHNFVQACAQNLPI